MKLPGPGQIGPPYLRLRRVSGHAQHGVRVHGPHGRTAPAQTPGWLCAGFSLPVLAIVLPQPAGFSQAVGFSLRVLAVARSRPAGPVTGAVLPRCGKTLPPCHPPAWRTDDIRHCSPRPAWWGSLHVALSRAARRVRSGRGLGLFPDWPLDLGLSIDLDPSLGLGRGLDELGRVGLGGGRPGRWAGACWIRAAGGGWADRGLRGRNDRLVGCGPRGPGGRGRGGLGA